MQRLSVIIPNYNYEEYLAEAIASALDLRWPDVEVIVVDDGSTDSSVRVAERFGDRITLLVQENRGQRSAADLGYAASTGDVVLFLDSDDVLPRDLPAVLDREMRSGVSKVQFQMQRIDREGALIGAPFPAFDPVPEPADVRRWFMATSAYPTPPGSGNAYPRWFLERVMSTHAGVDSALDSSLVAAAPVLGEVVSVRGLPVLYRQHDRNDSALLSGVGRFGREIRRAESRWHFAQSLSPEVPGDEVLRRSRELLQFRIAAARLESPDAVARGDGLRRLLFDIVRSPFASGPESVLRRFIVMLLCFAMLMAPGPLMRWVVRHRFGLRSVTQEARRAAATSGEAASGIEPASITAGERWSDSLRLTFVIPNHNYGRYIGAAIASALAVDWPDVEVIVVDDGSTDDSIAIVEAFGASVRLIRQSNQGPRVACNVGFEASSGDLVVFLDSDDVVLPQLRDRIDAAWRPSVSKLQFQMQRIDAEGLPTGDPFPVFRHVPSPEDIRRWMRATAAYPTPPGSGNVYSRTFLESLFPLDDSCGDSSDSACRAAAPFCGDVVTVPHPGFLYRVHGANRSDLTVDPARFTKQVQRAAQRHAFALRIDEDHPVADPTAPLFRGSRLLEMRIAQKRLSAEPPPLLGDGSGRMLRDVFTSAVAPGPDAVGVRTIRAAWCLTALVAPRPVVRRLVMLRYGLH